jgi:hypothetical protein
MSGDVKTIAAEFSQSLFVNTYFCILSWDGSSTWTLFIEGIGSNPLSSTTTNDPVAAQTEADTALLSNSHKRFTVWKQTDVAEWQAYVV